MLYNAIHTKHQLTLIVIGYFGDVFNDATTYMEHSGRPELDLEDIRLAIQSRVNYSFTEPPPVEVCFTNNVFYDDRSVLTSC